MRRRRTQFPNAVRALTLACLHALPRCESVRVSHRAEVAQLVRVDDGADRRDRAIPDLDDPHDDHRTVSIAHERARLAIDLLRIEPDAEGAHALTERGEQSRHALGALDRARP